MTYHLFFNRRGSQSRRKGPQRKHADCSSLRFSAHTFATFAVNGFGGGNIIYDDKLTDKNILPFLARQLKIKTDINNRR